MNAVGFQILTVNLQLHVLHWFMVICIYGCTACPLSPCQGRRLGGGEGVGQPPILYISYIKC